MIWDLEEMDKNWQIAMTAIKIRRSCSTGRQAEATRVDEKCIVALIREKLNVSIATILGILLGSASLKVQKKVTSRKQVKVRISSQCNLKRKPDDIDEAKYDELQSEFGDQEAALVAHKLAVKKLESQLKASYKQQSSLIEKLNFQANHIVEKIENSTVKIGLGYGIKSNAEEDIDDSLYEYGKYGPQPQSPSPTESDAINDDPTIPIPSILSRLPLTPKDSTTTVPKPSTKTVDLVVTACKKLYWQPIRTPVIPSTILSYNRKELESKNEKGTRQATQPGLTSKQGKCYTGHGHDSLCACEFWHSNYSLVLPRFNTGKQLVILVAVKSPVNRPFSRNTAHKSNKYAVKGKMGTAVKTSAGCVWRKVIPLSNTNSGPTPESNVIVSRGPQGRPKPVKAWVTRINWRILKNSIGDLLPLEVLCTNTTNGYQFTMSNQHKDWLVQEQTALGKDFSNPFYG
ncbi:hypothetical protein Tco_0282939 [Tanacetum coccineum]